jgi:hypothetical protein
MAEVTFGKFVSGAKCEIQIFPWSDPASCVKCGQRFTGEATAIPTVMWERRGTGGLDFGSDALLCQCQRCGYSWFTRCADYKADER